MNENVLYSTVPTLPNITEGAPRADPERTQSVHEKRTQIITSGPSNRSQVPYCVTQLSIKVVVNRVDNGGMELM
jgi:hypothetical protein